MSKRFGVTRREAIEAIAGAAFVSALPGSLAAEIAHRAVTTAREIPQASFVPPFSEDWRFYRGDARGAEAPDFDDARWRMIDVPHDWSIEDVPGGEETALWSQGTDPVRTGPFDIYGSEGQTATGWTVGGVGWYRKRFIKPAKLASSARVEVRFEGVYMNSDVWINGVHLGNHPYGYTEFAYDLTPHLNEGRNTLAVRVDNTGRNSRWYSGSGIYRKVWLSVAGGLRIPAHGLYVTIPEATQQSALVNLEVTVENGYPAQKSAVVKTLVLDATGAVAGEAQQSLTIPPGASARTLCAVRVQHPRLWSPDHPNLYRADATVNVDGAVADTASATIGLRTVEIDAVHGLRINGEPFKLRGGCIHHDNGPLGSVSIPRAEERRVELLRASGYNAIRTSHNPPSRDFLDACDRLGMMVIDEAFDCWEAAKNPQDYHLYFKEWWKRDLESMVMRDRNHPCVVLWSIGNEVTERAEPHGLEIGQQLRACVHSLDPTRKVTAAITGPYDHPGQTWKDMQPAFTYLDVGGYNYQWKDYANDHVNFPDRVMVGTESYPSAAAQIWDAIDNSSWVIGDFVWTAMDYIGESGLGRPSVQSARGRGGPPGGGGLGSYPWFNSYCGDIDLIGNKKAPSYFRDVVWRRSMVEMAIQRPVPKGQMERPASWGWSDELRSWTWPGFEEMPLTVRVYTRGDRVRLLLNGKEVGTKELGSADAMRAEFAVPYASGELQALAYQGGRQIGSVAFTTAGAARRLVLTPDRAKLKASRDDLSYVMVSVVDDHGRLVPDATIPVTFSLSGPAELAAVGNANPKDVTSFRQPRRDTFHGTCVAIVRPTGRPGAVHLRAGADRLEGASATIEIASA